MAQQAYMSGEENTDIVNALKKVLADTFVLYFKTHSFHWNVEGMSFKALHELFELQYTELWQATDEIAERIRALGSYAAANYQELLKDASLAEAGQVPDAKDMLEQLASDNREIVSVLYNALRAAEKGGDEATVDMLIARTQVHEKAAWMLESMGK